MSETTTANPSTIERAIETDLQAHIEDGLTVNAIRDGRIVQIRWNDLTPDERHGAQTVTFHLYEQEVANVQSK
jgi:hypothetical protein